MNQKANSSTDLKKLVSEKVRGTEALSSEALISRTAWSLLPQNYTMLHMVYFP